MSTTESHPAAKPILDAIAALRTYQPTSPQDAAALLVALGGDSTGRINPVGELLEQIVDLTVRTRKAFPEAVHAAIYAEDATTLACDTWMDGCAGEFAIGQAAAALARPDTVAPDFEAQFSDYL